MSMQRTLLKSKIHRASVTHCELNYEGSCAIDEDLLDASNICNNEQVHIWNINNGDLNDLQPAAVLFRSMAPRPGAQR